MKLKIILLGIIVLASVFAPGCVDNPSSQNEKTAAYPVNNNEMSLLEANESGLIMEQEKLQYSYSKPTVKYNTNSEKLP
ncbi:hypothetical protein [Methanolapillus ohkumae]|uniref:Uncharacterized protein n=1 Tax=Methanolapillus ohkumae TaxID=3028298 RepID=A0AA96V5P5_9EURY|nr:hypothetical protein MsAm2_09200 [Methanosarcinaceae archaeon Am2]